MIKVEEEFLNARVADLLDSSVFEKWNDYTVHDLLVEWNKENEINKDDFVEVARYLSGPDGETFIRRGDKWHLLEDH